MKKYLLMAFAFFAIFIASVAPAAAIVYGEPDGNDHPNVGMISVNSQGLCSGTLIAPTVFLTAGHCTDFLEEKISNNELSIGQVKVSFHKDDALHKGLIDVKEIITHPDYDDAKPASNPRDVGILILKKAQKKIDPATLASEGFLDGLYAADQLKGAKFPVVGYGATRVSSPTQIIPSDGQRRKALSEYQSLHDSRIILKQNQATDNSGTCFGDSGGPAFWQTEDGSEILIGITSSGDSACAAQGVYYRVDISDTLSFIASVLD
ncbi:MAG: trypsin-like serine protease [Anaerolineae bacterium]|nr:trypsin-like serine protease [Anaerolineae bacterium]